MITQLYYSSLAALFVVASVFVLLFLTQSNDKKATLRNYRIAKRILTIEYLVIAIGSLPELLMHLSGVITIGSRDTLISQIVTLTVAITQAFIFTHSCLLLLDIKKINPKVVKWQLLGLLIYIVVAILGYLLLPKGAIEAVVILLTVIYFIALAYLTARFLRHFRLFSVAMDNFYSDNIAARMRWVRVAFFAALFVGVFALYVTYYNSTAGETIFNFTSLCFYIFFGVKFINYPWQFEIIETPMTEETNDKQPLSIFDTATENISYEDVTCIDCNVCVGQWIAEKHFTESGITIDDLVKYLGTNRTYLSSYFNTEKGVTFRQWINSLRIEEAKLIITGNPKITMAELASRLGYADTSTFFRHFKTIEGVQPSVWKRKILSQ